MQSGLGFGTLYHAVYEMFILKTLEKKTNTPNLSPIKKIWFGLYWFGAGKGGRTLTPCGTGT